MKAPALIVLGILAIGGGAYALMNRETVFAPGGAPSVERIVPSGDNASAWVAQRFRARQQQDIDDPNMLIEEATFVPPAYLDRVAQCVVETLDREPDVGGQTVGREWRTAIPFADAIRDESTSELTQAEISRGEILIRGVYAASGSCKAQLIPTGEFQVAWAEHQRQSEVVYNAAFDAEQARVRTEQSQQRQASLCERAQRLASEQRARGYTTSADGHARYYAENCESRPTPTISATEVEAARERGQAAAGPSSSRESVRAQERTISDGATCEAQQGVWNAFERHCYLPNRN